MADQEAPKIIVDTDWKSQAQAEKERLAAAEQARAPKQAAPGMGAAMGAEAADEEQLPAHPDLVELVRMLATQALMYLGAFPDPETGRRMVALEPAQYNIEMLGVLEEKTKGNVTEEEKTFLSQMLYELRMRFVEISKAVAKAVEEGKIAPMGGGGAGGIVGGSDIKVQPAPKA